MFDCLVHRRTGGLENRDDQDDLLCSVHRRTGGLENDLLAYGLVCFVHRRTGGLETWKTFWRDSPSRSPPHRRLRNP